MKLISVIIPVYNVEDYLNRCIKSVLSQTYSNIEIILVDDGSKDRSGEVCDELAKKYKQIHVIHQQNKGLSEARNEGLNQALGEYIVFIDSDDFIHQDMLKILYENIIKTDPDISICSFRKVNENELDQISLSLQCNGQIFVYEGKEKLKRIYINNQETIVAWNKLYKCSLFESIKYPSNKLHEDEFVIHRLFYAASKVVYTDIELYYYLQRTGSIMNQKEDDINLKSYEDGWMAYKDRENFFKNMGENELLELTETSMLITVLERYTKLQKCYPCCSLLIDYKNTVKRILHNKKSYCYIGKKKWIEANLFLLFPKLYDKYVQLLYNLNRMVKNKDKDLTE